jgi:hypothetical protein
MDDDCRRNGDCHIGGPGVTKHVRAAVAARCLTGVGA